MRLVKALCGLAVCMALAVAGCDGFAELPLPERETGTMVVEGSATRPWRQGVLQLGIDVPDDATGPHLIVAPPMVTSGDALTVNWAHGPCEGVDASTPEGELSLCVAVWLVSDVTAPTFVVEAVVEARGSGRRFNLAVEVSP